MDPMFEEPLLGVLSDDDRDDLSRFAAFTTLCVIGHDDAKVANAGKLRWDEAKQRYVAEGGK